MVGLYCSLNESVKPIVPRAFRDAKKLREVFPQFVSYILWSLQPESFEWLPDLKNYLDKLPDKPQD